MSKTLYVQVRDGRFRPAIRKELDEALAHWDVGNYDVAMEGLVDAARAYRDLLANGERVKPDYGAAAKVLADNDGIEVIEWHEDLSRRVVDAAIGDKLLINPPTEEET